ncbi:MAG: potassium-transporting ATPase subunit KdpC [bacterium]
MKNLWIGLKLLLAMTVITGIIYPLFITGFAQLFFSDKANGSMIIKEHKLIGSELIGQKFTHPGNFWGRPSAIGNNPLPSGGSNLSPVGEELKEQVQARIDTIQKYHGNLSINQIPKDLLFASASGVDPHISPSAAYFQVDRIAKARNFDNIQKINLKELIKKSIESPDLVIFGDSRVNVLELNLKLNDLKNN